MLEIRKISENFYLVDGEYTASTFNDAVIIANQSKGKIKNFELGYMEISLWRKIKNKLKKSEIKYYFSVLKLHLILHCIFLC